MSLRTTRVVELRSVVGAASPCAPIRCSGSKLHAHVVTAPAALVQIQGGTSNNPAEMDTLAMIDVVGGGYAAATTMAAGHYQIVDRPNWVRVQIAADAAGPRTFRVELVFDMED